MLKPTATTLATPRLLLVDALRAVGATTVAWHHFALYGPLWDLAVPELSQWNEVLSNSRWAVQVFFVIGGYVMARSMARRAWNLRQAGRFVVRRYCRLGLPYLAAIALAIGACAVGRGWIPQSVLGPPPTWPQVLAHVVFLQDILGYHSLSAGLWFVCIDFQLGLVYVGLLFLQDAMARLSGRAAEEASTGVAMLLGWMLAALSLFFFNVDDRWDIWAVYFFGQFFMGVVVYHSLQNFKSMILFGLYALMMVAALSYFWRWQLAMSLVVGLVLFLGGKLGLLERWPTSRVVAYLGRTSYSLYLVHFSVLILVSSLWVRLHWVSPWNAAAGLVAAYLGSLVVAQVLFRVVDEPATELSRTFS